MKSGLEDIFFETPPCAKPFSENRHCSITSSGLWDSQPFWPPGVASVYRTLLLQPLLVILMVIIFITAICWIYNFVIKTSFLWSNNYFLKKALRMEGFHKYFFWTTFWTVQSCIHIFNIFSADGTLKRLQKEFGLETPSKL